MLRYGSVETPVGKAWVLSNERGIVTLDVGRTERRFLDDAQARFGERPARAELPAASARRVRDAARAGDGSGVDWSVFPAFQRRVLRETARIPAGTVRSYGWIANAIGSPRAARAVGTALATNPVPLIIPCHRVVRGDGSLGRYSMGKGTETKRSLLELEGALEGALFT
ncbi:MAG TPA: methylated-DNA--[protein]-cysteine S-methyltransferase [Actinomycetota bacterium]